MTEEQKRKQQFRLKRDTGILLFAVTMAAFEITLGGARPSVLTFLTGLFFSPLIMRVDERNKNGE